MNSASLPTAPEAVPGIVRTLLKVVGAIFAVVGFSTLAGALYLWYSKHQKFTTWPKVEADVLRSRVAEQDSRSSEGTSTTMYRAEIEFRYEFEGQEYQTPAVASYWTSSYASMQAKADRFSPGSRHEILLNPSNPREIYFDAGSDAGFFLVPLILSGVGFVFAAIGGGMLIAARVLRPHVCPVCGGLIGKRQDVCTSCGSAIPIHYPAAGSESKFAPPSPPLQSSRTNCPCKVI